jgi:hypothetical protein
MRYSVSVVHWTYKKNARQLYPVKVLVTVNRKPLFLHTPHKVTPEQWDNELREVIDHPNAKYINADLRRLVAEKEAELLTAGLGGEKVTSDFVKGKRRDRTLIGFAKEIAKKVTGKDGEEVVEGRVNKELNRIIEYKGITTLLADVDVTWLRKFDEFERRRGMAQNTRNSTFKWFRKVMRQAVAEKLIKDNPFDLFDAPEYIQPDTTYLVEEEKDAFLTCSTNWIQGTSITPLRTFFLRATPASGTAIGINCTTRISFMTAFYASGQRRRAKGLL